MNKIEALKKLLIEENRFTEEELVDTITESIYDSNTFAIHGEEYLVLDEDEREEMVTDYIRESLWAFNPGFLAGETDLPIEVFKALGERYEAGNDAVLKLIETTCGLEQFIEAAIDADGYGHFLSGYDGQEGEAAGEDGVIQYYIYRQN